jgi:hypothetical protein
VPLESSYCHDVDIAAPQDRFHHISIIATLLYACPTVPISVLSPFPALNYLAYVLFQQQVHFDSQRLPRATILCDSHPGMAADPPRAPSDEKLSTPRADLFSFSASII